METSTLPNKEEMIKYDVYDKTYRALLKEGKVPWYFAVDGSPTLDGPYMEKEKEENVEPKQL